MEMSEPLLVRLTVRSPFLSLPFNLVGAQSGALVYAEIAVNLLDRFGVSVLHDAGGGSSHTADAGTSLYG